MKYNPITDWSDREKKDHNGYIVVKVPEHFKSFDGGFYYEHRLVAEKMLGRVLKTWETVHHLNEDKTCNDWLNLFVCTRREHDRAVWLTANG